jgi:hypothetical protein
MWPDLKAWSEASDLGALISSIVADAVFVVLAIAALITKLIFCSNRSSLTISGFFAHRHASQSAGESLLP